MSDRGFDVLISFRLSTNFEISPRDPKFSFPDKFLISLVPVLIVLSATFGVTLLRDIYVKGITLCCIRGSR